MALCAAVNSARPVSVNKAQAAGSFLAMRPARMPGKLGAYPGSRPADLLDVGAAGGNELAETVG
jgi:hypothetical protein